MIADRPLLGFSCVMLLDGREEEALPDLPRMDLFTTLQVQLIRS
jgi:hypothetical protein